MQKSEALEYWKKIVCYEIYPSSFQDANGDGFGDLKGIANRLDYLESLGVGCIWMTPVYASPMRDNGYDVSDFYKINPQYGTMEDMDELLAKAREHHIVVMMDLVFNHVSKEHPWFLESQKSRDNSKSDWFIWKDPKPDGSPPNNWRGIFGGSAWTWNAARGQYYLHTFGDFQPDLNWENPEVRKALYDIANFWIGKGVGAFRIDAIVYIKKPKDFADGKPDASDGMVLIHDMTANTDGILDFLREFKTNVWKNKNVFTVAEANGIRPEELKNWVGENGVFDMLFEFNHLQGGDIWFKAKKLSMLDIKMAIVRSQMATAENGWYPIFWENHDKPRSISANFSNAADPVLAGKALLTLLLTLRGTPFVYQGEEIGMTNVNWDSIDAYNELNSRSQYELARREGFGADEAIRFVQAFSRDNARTPMQWDSSANAGFTCGKPWLALNENYPQINVQKEEGDPESVLAWFRRLSKFREKSEVLLNGDFQILLADDERIFAYKRTFRRKSLTILVNFSEADAFYDKSLLGDATLLFSNYGDAKKSHLRPLEANIFSADG